MYYKYMLFLIQTKYLLLCNEIKSTEPLTQPSLNQDQTIAQTLAWTLAQSLTLTQILA